MPDCSAQPLLGAAFGLAWAPCLTPTFSAVYGLAFQQGTAGRGAFLMLFYCLGLGVPFVLVALGVGWVSGALGFLRRHMRLVSQVGGVLLIVIGVLLVTGVWNHWMDELRSSRRSGLGVRGRVCESRREWLGDRIGGSACADGVAPPDQHAHRARSCCSCSPWPRCPARCCRSAR